MESSALQEQFYLIQEQQKRRFKQRPKAGPEPSFHDDIPNKEHQNDDLDLKTATQFEVDMLHSSHHTDGIPKATITDPAETKHHDVQFLQAQVQEIQLENAQLKSRLKQTEAKLVEVNRIRQEERQALGSTSTTATQRIVELSKRNRELNAEVASERNIVRQLQKKLKEAVSEKSESKQISFSKSIHGRSNEDDHTQQENVQAITEHLKEQLQVSNQKRAEYRNECQVLKQELKLSHKVISKEVGEGANVSSLLNSVSGWRGRSQQIIALQNKVSELQQKVLCLSKQKQSPGESTSTVSHVNADSRQISALKKLEETKKKSLEESRSELATLQIEHSKLQQQCLALKSRNKTLATELKSLRVQMETPNHSLENAPRAICNSQSSPKDTLDAQDRLALEQRNQRLQAQLSKCLSELQSLKQPDHYQTNTVLQKQSVAINARQPRSAPLPPVIPPGSRGSKRPSNSLSRKAASAGQSLTSGTSFYNSALDQVSQIEKERLTELTYSLQQRLDTSTDKLLRTDSDLRNARQQITRLEKQVGRNPGRTTKHTSKESGIHDVSELEAKLEIQKNENEVLKETLDQTRLEKLTDMKLFQDMMRETKQLFVDSVKQLYSQQSRT